MWSLSQLESDQLIQKPLEYTVQEDLDKASMTRKSPKSRFKTKMKLINMEDIKIKIQKVIKSSTDVWKEKATI